VTVKAVWHFSDTEGETSALTTYTDAVATVEGAGGVALMNALIALSEAQVNRVAITSINVEATPGTPQNGPYATERESLTLEFQSTLTGKTFEYNVPAPDEIFSADDEDFDGLVDTDLDGLPDVIDAAVTALQTHLKDPHGNAMVFRRAYRGKTRPRD
jgi:hypothetical protein